MADAIYIDRDEVSIAANASATLELVIPFDGYLHLVAGSAGGGGRVILYMKSHGKTIEFTDRGGSRNAETKIMGSLPIENGTVIGAVFYADAAQSGILEVYASDDPNGGIGITHTSDLFEHMTPEIITATAAATGAGALTAEIKCSHSAQIWHILAADVSHNVAGGSDTTILFDDGTNDILVETKTGLAANTDSAIDLSKVHNPRVTSSTKLTATVTAAAGDDVFITAVVVKTWR